MQFHKPINFTHVLMSFNETRRIICETTNKHVIQQEIITTIYQQATACFYMTLLIRFMQQNKARGKFQWVFSLLYATNYWQWLFKHNDKSNVNLFYSASISWNSLLTTRASNDCENINTLQSNRKCQDTAHASKKYKLFSFFFIFDMNTIENRSENLIYLSELKWKRDVHQ